MKASKFLDAQKGFILKRGVDGIPGGGNLPSRGHPPGLVSYDLDLWAYANGVTLDFNRPGNRPTTH
jgi:hypothetical protein